MKIGNVVSITSGFAFKSSKFNDEGIGMPVVRIRDVGKNESDTFTDEKFDKKYLLKDGDMLIGMDGDFRLKRWHGGPALLNQRVCKIEPLNGKIDSGYIYYLLPRELKKIEDSTSFATVKHLSVKKINEIEIPLPPLPIQQKIAEILDTADRIRRRTQQVLEKYDQMAQSLFLEMFGDPVRNEKGWEVKKLKEIVSENCPLTYGIVQPGDHYMNGIPVVRPVDLVDDYVGRDNLKLIDPSISNKFKRTVLEGGEILLCVRGTTGVTSIAKFELKGANVTRGITPIWFDKMIASSNFIFHQLKSLPVQNLIQEKTYGIALKQINLKDVRELPIALPPISVQNQFALIIEKIEQQKQQAKVELDKSEELFKSLMQRAFKGELFAKKT
ncbi:MAG: restriction endonuclease subunit S [Bacteroidota bacterium]